MLITLFGYDPETESGVYLSNTPKINYSKTEIHQYLELIRAILFIEDPIFELTRNEFPILFNSFPEEIKIVLDYYQDYKTTTNIEALDEISDFLYERFMENIHSKSNELIYTLFDELLNFIVKINFNLFGISENYTPNNPEIVLHNKISGLLDIVDIIEPVLLIQKLDCKLLHLSYINDLDNQKESDIKYKKRKLR